MWKTAWITSPGLRWTVLLLTLASSTATAQSIAVERFTIPPPETAFQGEVYRIIARLTVTDRPAGSSIGFVARYIGANIADTVSVGSGPGTLRGVEIRILPRTCFPVCNDPDIQTVADSLVDVPDRIDLIPVILNAQGETLVTGEATRIPVSKTGNVTIAPTNQPLQNRQRVRVTMENANFTEGGATVFFRDTRDARGSDPIQTINWSASSNRRPVCGDMQPLRQVVSCAPEIISATTFEFTIDTFLLPNDAARYDGQTFDIIAASPAGSNVALNAFRFGGGSATPPPVISSISPDTVTAGSPSFILTVDGSGFSSEAVVLWDDQPLGTEFINSEQVTAFVPREFIDPSVVAAVAGKLPTLASEHLGNRQVPIRVNNTNQPDPAQGLSNPVTLTVTPAPAVPNDSSVLPPGFKVPDFPRPTTTKEIFTRLHWRRPTDARCDFRKDGTITIDVFVDRYFGAVDEQGRLTDPDLLVRNGVISSFARLRVAAWDVDSGGASGFLPEADRVRVNGRDLGSGSFLKGSDNNWSFSDFRVPIEELRFPSLPPDSGSSLLLATNRIEIEIDTADPSGPIGWCVAVGWVSLEISAMAPWILVHGTNARAGSWEIPVQGRTVPQHLESLGIPFDHQINLLPNGSAEGNARALFGEMQSRVQRFGTKRFHLITHSKGATDAREMFSQFKEFFPDEFAILTLFSLGTPSKGTIVSDLAVAADSVDVSRALKGDGSDDPEIADLVRSAKAANATWVFGCIPEEPARGLQTIARMAEFNRTHTKPKSVQYFSIAGNADVISDDMIELAELEAFLSECIPLLPEFVDNFLNVAAANRVHRMLSRIRGVTLKPMSRREVVQGLFPQIVLNSWTIVKVERVQTPRLNDLVSTTDSVHCTSCDFVSLGSNICPACPQGIYEENHSSLKRARIIDVIHQKIRALFPLTDFGGAGSR